MASVTTEDEIRHHARMEWNAAAPGWKKYGKKTCSSGWMAPVSDQLIMSTGITSGQTVLDVVLN